MKQVMVVLIAMSGVARAGTPEEDYGNKLVMYVGWDDRWKDSPRSYSQDYTPEKCTAIVADARKAGLKTVHQFGFRHLDGQEDITLDRADQLCTDYGKGWRLAAANSLFSDLALLKSNLTPSLGPSENYVQGVLKKAADCTKAANTLLADGQPPDLQLKIGGPAMTLGEVKAQLCDATVKACAIYTKQMKDIAKKENERLVKAGLGGDKLSVFKEQGGDDGGIYLAGFTTSDDPKVYAKASTWFVWLTGAPDADNKVIHTIRKYTFNGNKLGKTTETTVKTPYGERPGKDAFN